MKKPRRFVRMFQGRFSGMVERGEKCRTIRPRPKRIPKPGDVIDCRCWEDKPYRSKQRKLREAVVCQVREVRIEADGVLVDGYMMLSHPAVLDAFAVMDGFLNWAEMGEWFRNAYGVTFEGVMLMWDPLPEKDVLTNSAGASSTDPLS